jgi:hypothetical protein
VFVPVPATPSKCPLKYNTQRLAAIIAQKPRANLKKSLSNMKTSYHFDDKLSSFRLIDSGLSPAGSAIDGPWSATGGYRDAITCPDGFDTRSMLERYLIPVVFQGSFMEDHWAIIVSRGTTNRVVPVSMNQPPMLSSVLDLLDISI